MRFKRSFLKYCLSHSAQMTIAGVWNFPENWFQAEDLPPPTYQKTSAKRSKSKLLHESDAVLFNVGCDGGHWNNIADLVVLRRSLHHYVCAFLNTPSPLQHFNSILHLLTFSCVLLSFPPSFPFYKIFFSFWIQWLKWYAHTWNRHETDMKLKFVPKNHK